MSEPPRPSQGKLVEFGSAIGCGLLAAVLGAGPAALRMNDVASAHAWLSLAACATPVMTLAVLVFREAYAGLRAFMGERRGHLRIFVSVWLVSFVPLLYFLGALLRTHTHHRPLAGVTFGLVGLVLIVACGAFARRFANVADAIRAAGKTRASMAISSAVHALAAIALLLAAKKLHGRLPSESGATMVDVTALGLAAALTGRPELRGFRGLAIFGALAAMGVVAIGISRITPDFAIAIAQRAPTFGLMLGLLFGK